MQGALLSQPTQHRSEPTLPVPAAELRRYSGEVCYSRGCGAADDLVDAGVEYTRASDGSRLGWPVRTCPVHARGRR